MFTVEASTLFPQGKSPQGKQEEILRVVGLGWCPREKPAREKLASAFLIRGKAQSGSCSRPLPAGARSVSLEVAALSQSPSSRALCLLGDCGGMSVSLLGQEIFYRKLPGPL